VCFIRGHVLPHNTHIKGIDIHTYTCLRVTSWDCEHVLSVHCPLRPAGLPKHCAQHMWASSVISECELHIRLLFVLIRNHKSRLTTPWIKFDHPTRKVWPRYASGLTTLYIRFDNSTCQVWPCYAWSFDHTTHQVWQLHVSSLTTPCLKFDHTTHQVWQLHVSSLTITKVHYLLPLNLVHVRVLDAEGLHFETHDADTSTSVPHKLCYACIHTHACVHTYPCIYIFYRSM
jgi:hypothetical protein